MNDMLKKIIGILAAIFILSVAYYGSYLPLMKSMTFITAMQGTGNIKTLPDFENLFKTPLGMTSPIGQEELVRNTASSILGTIQNVPDPRVVDELNKFITSYYDPIIARGVGMSFGQDVYLLGALNEVSFVKTQNPIYVDAAERYYKRAVDLGPQRPQGLYGLFDIYRMKGDTAQVKTIGEEILTIWPTDDRTRSALSDFLAQHATSVAPVVAPKSSKTLKSPTSIPSAAPVK